MGLDAVAAHPDYSGLLGGKVGQQLLKSLHLGGQTKEKSLG